MFMRGRAGGSGVVLLATTVLTLAAAGTSCGADNTGLMVDVSMGSMPVDELRFSVTMAAPAADASSAQLLLDPAAKGRVTGPFVGTSVHQPIYLDAADGD